MKRGFIPLIFYKIGIFMTCPWSADHGIVKSKAIYIRVIASLGGHSIIEDQCMSKEAKKGKPVSCT